MFEHLTKEQQAILAEALMDYADARRAGADAMLQSRNRNMKPLGELYQTEAEEAERMLEQL